MKYTNSYKISVDFKPWMDNGYRFSHLRLIEELGGTIASGVITMDLNGSEESLKLITDQFTGNLVIEKEDGNVYNIDVFITSRNFYKNSLSLAFICINDKNFLTSLVTTTHTDITSAIDYLYPGKKDIRCETDIANDLKIYQNTETNYSLCTKLAYSFRQKIVFGYGWDGLIIKELIGIDSGGNREPYWTLAGGLDFLQSDSYLLNYDKDIYQFPIDPWEDRSIISTNLSTLKLYSDYLLMNTTHKTLISNYLYNQKYMNTSMYSSFRIVSSTQVPEYRLGDVVKYVNSESKSLLPFTKYLINSNEMFISIDGSKYVDESGLNYSWTSKLIGLEEDGNLLPEIDPTN